MAQVTCLVIFDLLVYLRAAVVQTPSYLPASQRAGFVSKTGGGIIHSSAFEKTTGRGGADFETDAGTPALSGTTEIPASSARASRPPLFEQIREALGKTCRASLPQ